MTDERRYWHVYTGYDNSENERDLGVHFGSVTEIVWHLAEDAHGFYMEHGYLEFIPAKTPTVAPLKPGKRCKVNIKVHRTYNRHNHQLLTEKQLATLVRGSGSHIEPSNYYDQAYLVRDEEKAK